jgi:hypothetical protein
MARDALVIGINTYQHLPPLSAPAHDAEAIAQRLETDGHFDIVHRLPAIVAEDGSVQVGHQTPVTRQQLRKAISQLLNSKTDTQIPDTVLLYFSGHGWQSDVDSSDHYLATSDANPAEDFGVDFQWLRSQLDKSPVRQQIIWLDCCTSGGLLNFDDVLLGKQGQARDRYIVTASRDAQAAYQDPASPYSLFTQVLLEGLDPSHSVTGVITSSALTLHLETALKPKLQSIRCYSTGEPIQLTRSTTPPQPADAAPPKWAIPLQMPPLPDHFVARPDHEAALKARLLSADPKIFGTLVVSAIYGLGGIGKSVLATQLAHDEQVQARFCDGILWATLGQNPDLLPLLSGWIQSLGDMDYKPTAVTAAASHLRTLLYDKQVLLVVDDIWHPEHLEPFRVGGNRCCVLVTTREARIPDAHRYALDVMSPEQSLALMTQKLSDPLSTAETEQALAFAQRVGYLPLALELAASQIEDGVSWGELLDDFQAEVVRLETLDLYGQDELPDDAQRRNYSLTACFNLSLKQLAPEQLRQFAALGVVYEDVSLTQAMAATLWQVSERQAGSILRQFSSKTLLLPGAQQPGQRRTYRLHDLMHDLAQCLLSSPPEPSHPGDLPGLGLNKAEAHQQLLTRYRSKTQQGQWHTLPDDGYIYAHLSWHMAQAQQPDAVHQLLQETNEAGRNGWYEACEAIGKPAGFVNDLVRGWELAVAQYEQDPENTLAHLFRYALMRTSLNSLASNLPAELLGALVEKQVWQPVQGLAYAQQVQDPTKRAKCLGALAPYLPEALLPEVLRTVGQFHEAAYRAFVLTQLAEHFLLYWPQVLEAVGQMQERPSGGDQDLEGFSYRAKALKRVVPKLSSDLLSEALALARQIQDDADRAEALIALAQQQPELFPEALETTRRIQDKYTRAHALIALAQQQPELFSEVLEATRNLRSEYTRAEALGALARHLPPELFPEALRITRNLRSEYTRAIALIALAQQQPELFPEALETTRRIQDEGTRAITLIALAQRQPDLLLEVLETIRHIQDDHQQVGGFVEGQCARALIALASRLPPELFPEALETTRRIQDEYTRARALIALAQQQPELFSEVLEATRNLRSEDSRAEALGALARCLPPEPLLKVLGSTRRIQDEYTRARALIALAQQQPELFPEALETTRRIQDKYTRAHALLALAQQQPELFSEVLEATRNLRSEDSRAEVLGALARHLPPELFPEALRITRNLRSEYTRAIALIALAQQQPELFPEALETTRRIQDEDSRAEVLGALARHLPPELFSEALETTRSLKSIDSRSCALIALAQEQPDLFPEVLETIRTFRDEFFRARALSNLAPHLPPALFPEALETTYNFQDEYFRAIGLIALAQQQPDLFSEVLETTRNLRSEASRAFALNALTQQIPPTFLEETVALVAAVKDPYHRAQAWGGLLNRLDELNLDFVAFADLLVTLAYQNRSDLLENFPDLTATLTRLGGPGTLSACLQVMREVCHQWP